MRRLVTGILIVVAVSGALAGCSQAAAVAPVGGNHLAEVRFASIDVLTAAQVDIQTAPVCSAATDTSVDCTGSTTGGETITVISPAADKTVMTVTVGSKTVYSGSITDVLDNAARATS